MNGRIIAMTQTKINKHIFCPNKLNKSRNFKNDTSIKNFFQADVKIFENNLRFLA